jgi:hypothetical protein
MAVAHLNRTIQDKKTGRVITGVQIMICEPGTLTPISESIYSDVGLTEELPNPYTCLTGVVDVYLADPKTILLQATYGDSTDTADWMTIVPRAETFILAPARIDIDNVPGTGQFLQAVDSETATWADISETFPTVDSVALAWFLVQAFQYVSITRDGNGVLTSADIFWPDGAAGVYTADTISSIFPGHVDGWHATRVTGSGTATYTQPDVTRDVSGNITDQPVVVIS